MNKKTYEKRLKIAKQLAGIREKVTKETRCVIYEPNNAIYNLPNKGIFGQIANNITYATIVKVTNGNGHTIRAKDSKIKKQRALSAKMKIEAVVSMAIDDNTAKEQRTKKREFYRNCNKKLKNII